MPRDERVFSIWKSRIANEKMEPCTAVQAITRFYICGVHFIDNVKQRRGLIKNSLPTKRLPNFFGRPILDHSLYCVPDETDVS